MMFRGILFAFLLLFPYISYADKEKEPQGFRPWLREFKVEAIERGISKDIVAEAVYSMKYNHKVITLDRKQPEKVSNFNSYYQNVVTPERIALAKHKLNYHTKLLDKIEEQYGVPPQYIIALWAIESDFGRQSGKFNTINSLATLAFDGRRHDFYKEELFNALKIIEEEGLDSQGLAGSWAGAFGQCQFMPSSYLKYAVDFNQDGKRDIWRSHGDIFASIANYLVTVGWSNHMTWGEKVVLDEEFDLTLADLNITKTAQEWKNLGVKVKSDIDNRTEASIILLDNQKSMAFMVYSNYKTLLDWNRSRYFATSVGMLADAIVE